MFKRLFGGVEPEKILAAEIFTPVIPVKNGDKGELTLTTESVSRQDADRRPTRTFHRLRDMANQLPGGMLNRVREIAYTLAQTCAETHRLLVVILTEVLAQNENNKLFLDQSEDWEVWFRGFSSRATDYRKGTREKVLELVGRLEYDKKDAGRLNALVEAKPGEMEMFTGLTGMEDIKTILADIGVLLGRENETSLSKGVIDEPVRVKYA